MDAAEKILENILAFDCHIKDYELIHTYFGTEKLLMHSKKIKPADARDNLIKLKKDLKNGFPDKYPCFRRTYCGDLIDSVLAQVDIFVFGNKKKYTVKKAVENLFAVKLPGLFNFKDVKKNLAAELKKEGFSSIADFRARGRKVKFKDFDDFKRFARGEVKKSFSKIKRSFGRHIPVDLKKLFSKFDLIIEKPRKGYPECYYYYKGGYRGVAGLRFKKELGSAYIKGLIAHEISPGHHFYYIIKESLYRDRKADMLSCLDTFYSPETIINEGLAMSVDILFEGVLDGEVKIKGLTEKYFHKVLYNIWYSRFVLKKKYKKYEDILYGEFGFSKKEVNFWIGFYLGEDWRYYAVSYAIGSHYVDSFLKKHGLKSAKYLYSQQSLNTLKKQERHYEDGRK
ncbi:MAG: hypothetical protein ABIH00_03985 [Armatimonadota bacterium]